jgi:uncharacterized membrane protein
VLLRRAFLVLSTFWAASIPLATFAASRPYGSSFSYAFALSVYAIGHVVCHQLPARSFHLWMTSLPVCARCTGIYAAAAATAVVLALVPRTSFEARSARVDPKRVLLLALVPTAVTLIFEWTTGVMPPHWVRALAGVPLGAAVAWAIGMVN